MGKAVLLSAGHSLSDPGAVNGDTKESNLNMALVGIASDIIRKHGVEVINVPNNLSLIDTIKYANDRASQISICVEVHINAGGGKGIEAWYFHNFNTGKGSETSKKLSQCLVDGIVGETGMISRGVKDESTCKWGRFGFVHDTVPLASLVECGFIDSSDLAILTSGDGQQKIATGIAKGILSYLGVGWNQNAVTPPAPPAQPAPQGDPEKEQLKQRVNDLESKIGKARDILSN